MDADSQKMGVGITGVVLVAAIFVFFSLGRSFLPPFNEVHLRLM
jgi:Cu(I)/Ag(I) efflux system membrane protein CusA/SilA